MAQISRVTTWVTNQLLTSSALNGEFNNLITAWNNADTGSSTWTSVVASAATVNGVLTVTPSSGNTIINARHDQNDVTQFLLSNQNNTSAADILLYLFGGGASGGDQKIRFDNSVQAWSLGLDNSDSTKFKLSKGGTLGTNDVFYVDTSQNFSVANTHFQIGGNQAFPILQIVTGTTSSATTSTSSSYVDTNLTLSITPKFNTSKILVFACGTIGLVTPTAVLAQASATLTRNSTTLGGQTANLLSQVASQNIECPISLVYYDSPATVSATTYKVQILRTVVSGSATVSFPIVGDAQIIAAEIAQ